MKMPGETQGALLGSKQEGFPTMALAVGAAGLRVSPWRKECGPCQLNASILDFGGGSIGVRS